MKRLHTSGFIVQVNRVLNLDSFNDKFRKCMYHENVLNYVEQRTTTVLLSDAKEKSKSADAIKKRFT